MRVALCDDRAVVQGGLRRILADEQTSKACARPAMPTQW